MKRALIFSISICLLSSIGFSQSRQIKTLNAAEIRLALKKFQVVGSALYVAAHPDDENTRVITYLANEEGLSTTYLSLTRGDGGQNLIGKEVRELLGVIRTQELLAARYLDGGQQMFTRANDFGYSKIPDETFNIWDKEKVLADAVWSIRKLRPDVVITRFNPNGAGKTHGHHTASAIIAKEAFAIAGDSTKFPEQLEYVQPWQPKRIVWNGSNSPWSLSRYPELKVEDMRSLNAGVYNPFLGRSYGEIAALSRSEHKSQGFGSSLQRGNQMEYFLHLDGEEAQEHLLEGIDLTWNRIKGGKKIASLINNALETYDLTQPEKVIPQLVEIKKELGKLTSSNPYIANKKKELDYLILQCAGVWADITAQSYGVTPGDSLYLTARVIGRNGYNIYLKSIDLGVTNAVIDTVLLNNQMKTQVFGVVVPSNMAYSQPYWLRKPEEKGMFQVEQQELIGLPENPASIAGNIAFEVEGETVNWAVPVLYRSTDRVQGERYRPLEITPPVTVDINKPVFLFANDAPKEIPLLVKSHTNILKGELSLEVPKGWRYEPAIIPVEINAKYAELKTAFRLYPPKGASTGEVKAIVSTSEGRYSYGLTRIEYEHIPVQTLFPPSTTKVIRLDIKTNEEKVGYIPGAGDVIPEALQEIGYKVDILSDEELNAKKFSEYDVIIIGVRAYNTQKRMKFVQGELMEFVKNGGNMIVQYNTSGGLVTDNLGPYSLKLSRNRVTVEEAPVTVLENKHELVNFPNKITQDDFEGWAQERGLYFPSEWDKNYTAILEMHDPGEPERKGSLLVANYGKGSYIYSGLSFFRELPAGVPGAYRLFVNMISYKNNQKTDTPVEKSNK